MMPAVPANASPFRALLRFHLAAGARLAMRALVPALAATVGGGFLLGTDFLTSIAHVLFGGGSDGSRGGSSLLLAALCLGAAAVAAPRIRRGADGWLRHLPLRAVDHRRAVAWAVAAAETPLVLLLLLLAAFATRRPGPLLADGLAIAVTAFAAAQAVVPARRIWLVRPCALAAALLADAGGWRAVALAAGLAVVADLAAGPLPQASRAALSGRAAGGGSGAAVPWRIAARALGWRSLGAYLAALLPLAAVWAFTHHNDLGASQAALAERLGAVASPVLFLAQLGETLAVRRPAWPWSRSLAWSAAQRVRSDALFLATAALPLLAMAALLAPRAALWSALVLPLLALRAAGALRRAPERRSGAAGEILAEGMLLAAAFALVPWLALPALAALPLAQRAAAERERRQKVSRWLELHHLAAGDPQSWSAT
jgi:hypothetical protein